MKKIISAVATILICMSVQAQKEKIVTGSNEISINAGIASPYGSFSKGDYADEKSGFAKTGVHLNLSGVHYFNKNWGIGLLLGYSQYGHKGTQSLADGYKEDSGTDSTTLYTKGTNRTLSILAGPYYRLPISHKFAIDIRALAGYVNTHLAGFQIFYEDYLENSMSQKESSGGGFGYQLGAGVKYSITDNIAIKANADYFSSNPKINISYDNFIVNSGRRLTTYNEAVSGINSTLGIAFSF